MRNAELFQCGMRKLRKSRTGFQPVSPAGETGKMPVLRYARAAVVVPNGTLFGDAKSFQHESFQRGTRIKGKMPDFRNESSRFWR